MNNKKSTPRCYEFIREVPPSNSFTYIFRFPFSLYLLGPELSGWGDPRNNTKHLSASNQQYDFILASLAVNDMKRKRWI